MERHSCRDPIPDLRERFCAKATSQIPSITPGAVAVLDDDTAADGSAYLVMELLEGESLERVLERRETIAIPEMIEIGRQSLDVLASGHRRGVIHRDLKPANMLLTTSGVLNLDRTTAVDHLRRPATRH
jgi:serine/threonine protein kinase